MVPNSKGLKVQIIVIVTIITSAVILAVGANLVKTDNIAKKINENIKQGSANLTLGKINEAKKNFQEAIGLQKENRKTYITIKDEYVKTGRLDDALAILKEGKNNNVIGVEAIIQEIKLKFQDAKLEKSAYQNETYTLPENVMIKINNEDTSVKVTWNSSKAETNILGNFIFEGVAEEYERPVKLTLHIIPKPIIKVKQIGYISKVYEIDGKRYLTFDDVKFLVGDEAIIAAKKDGNAGYENGRYFVYNDYYIVNDSQVKKDYIISNSASLNILAFLTDSNSVSVENKPVSYDKFKTAVKLHDNLLCYIYTENDLILEVEGQYTP